VDMTAPDIAAPEMTPPEKKAANYALLTNVRQRIIQSLVLSTATLRVEHIIPMVQPGMLAFLTDASRHIILGLQSEDCDSSQNLLDSVEASAYIDPRATVLGCLGLGAENYKSVR